MSETLTISKDPPELRSMRYSLLREKGLEYIRNLSGKLWTNHNLSDPGITLLEILCYAMTDLGYRTNFNIEDILASSPFSENSILKDFHQAHKILPNGPYTLNDFRKLLIDEPGIRNAWLEVSQKTESGKVDSNTGKPSPLNGLYDVRLELENVYPLFLKDDVTNFKSFALKLKDAIDPVSEFLKNQFKLSTKELLDVYDDSSNPSEELQSSLIDELNEVLQSGVSIYNEARFADVSFREKTEVLMTKNLLKEDIMYLNRHLLEDAYPEEITKDSKDFDLGSNVITRDLTIESGSRKIKLLMEATFQEMFQYWDKIDPIWLQPNQIERISLDNDIKPISSETSEDYYTSEWTIQFDDESQVSGFPVRIKIIPPIALSDTALKKKVKARLEDASETGIFQEFKRKMQRSDEIVQRAKKRFLSNRNLCEDYYSFEATRIQEISVQANIEIEPEVSAEEILTKVYLTLDEFLSPPIRFYSMNELLEDGYSVDEIFEGPLLRHGFIKDEDLETIKRQNVIYTSDLVRVIMKSIPQIRAVTDLEVSLYIKNNQRIAGEKNCIRLTSIESHKPKLSIKKSKIKLTKSSQEVYQDTLPGKSRLIDTIEELKKTSKIRKTLQEYTLDIPDGKGIEITDYHPIQEEFPQTYGIGKGTLPDNSADERKGQAMQLKGYLLFFEQLLTNALAQLASVRELFTYRPGITRSYFYSPLYQVADIHQLLAKFDEGDTDWEDFIADNTNSYLQNLASATENSEAFFARRNRFLDHLLARFAEDFTDYTLNAYTSEKGLDTREKASAVQAVSQTKLQFLQKYPELSATRANAFDYTQKPLWNTENVSGFERRVAGLLGIADYRRRSLAYPITDPFEIDSENDNNESQTLGFHLKNDNGNILLSSNSSYSDKEALDLVIQQVIKYGKELSRYRIYEKENNQIYFNLVNEENEVIARSVQASKNSENAEKAIKAVADFIDEKYFSNEGFHVVEHILLRPKAPPSGSSNESLLASKMSHVNPDGYSFQVSILVPNFAGRFQESEFQTLLRNVLADELPAHIMPHIFFLDRETLNKFENLYRTWLETEFDPTKNYESKRTAREALVIFLNELQSP